MLIRELFALKCVSCIVKARRHGRTAIDIAKMRLLFCQGTKARQNGHRYC